MGLASVRYHVSLHLSGDPLPARKLTRFSAQHPRNGSDSQLGTVVVLFHRDL